MTNWVDRYYARTRPPFAELARHFFLGLFRPESMAGEDSFTTWLVQILAVLVAASWYIPIQLFRRYADLHAMGNAAAVRLAYSSDCLWALTLMAWMTAVLTTLEWPALFPSQRDQLILTPLPITRLELFAAKLGSLFLFVTLFILAITVLSGIALPAIASGPLETRPLWLQMGTFLIGAIGLCYLVFLSLLALQGVLLMVLPLRWFASVSFAVQVGLLVALLCAFPLFPYFPARQMIASHSPVLAWFPPAWFLSLSDGRAATALLAAFALAATTYLASYLQIGKYAIESPRHDHARRLNPLTLIAHLFRAPQARATADFIGWTLARGREQKMTFLLILAIGLALVLESSVYLTMRVINAQSVGRVGRLSGAIESAVIGLPLTLSFFSMVGMRRVFRSPADLAANWLFRFTEEPAVRRVQLDATFIAFVGIGGLPALLVCAPAEFIVLGSRAILALAVQVLLLLTLAEHLLHGWNSIPFTCAPNPARRHVMQSAIVHIFELSLYSFMSSTWIAAGLHEPWFLVKFAAVAAAGFVWLRRRRLRDWGKKPLEFAESLSPGLEPLKLLPE